MHEVEKKKKKKVQKLKDRKGNEKGRIMKIRK